MRRTLTDAAADRGRNAAQQARQRRAEIKAKLRDGSMSVERVIELAASDPALARLRVRDAVQAIPGIGPIRADQIIADAHVASGRRLGGLGHRQADHIAQLTKAHSRV